MPLEGASARIISKRGFMRCIVSLLTRWRGQYLRVLQNDKKGNKVTCMASRLQDAEICAGVGVRTGLDEMNFKDPTK